MKNEIWKPITEFPTYEVSNYSRVRNKYGKIFRQFEGKKGYLRVTLKSEGKQIWRTSHRLAAIEFIPNPDNKEQINHKDGNKLNNHIDNLEWATQSENQLHRFNVLGIRHKKGSDSPIAKPVNQYDLNGNLICEFGSLEEASKKTNISAKYISACKTGKTKTAGGFIWKI